MMNFRDAAEKVIGEFLPIEEMIPDEREAMLDRLTRLAMSIVDDVVA